MQLLPARFHRGIHSLMSKPVNWINLTPERGDYTFGYYDRYAWNADGDLHLALRIPQQERLPAMNEIAEVGIIRRLTRKFIPLATTNAWNHQQGAMTLWLPRRPDCFVFNDYDSEAGHLIARICDIHRGVVGQYDVPIYSISDDGQWASSLNFARIPRRGYSYACSPLPIDHPMPALDDDGLFLIDLHSGKRTLIAPYRTLLAHHPFPWDLEGQYIWLNHAIFNCDGSRLMVLLRHTGVAEPKLRKTHLMTMAIDGGGIQCSLSSHEWGRISHQIWGRGPREILVDADWCNRGSEYVVFDESVWPRASNRVSRGNGAQGHLNISPDGAWMVADTYPIGGFQQLFLVRMADGECRKLGEFKHDAGELPADVRCDLHPRWSRDGSLLSIDTIHDGKRSIYMLEMEEVFLNFEELHLVSKAH